MAILVHIAPENQANSIRRTGIAPRRWKTDLHGHPGVNRTVWAFPVLPSYTLTHSWARELKRWGRTTLSAVSFRIADDETVLASHYARLPARLSAAEAVALIQNAADPRGYEIIVPRRIAPNEIIRIRALPKAVGWRYWPGARGRPMRLCDCPVCLPRGEVKARRYRERVFARMAAAGIERST